MKVKGARLHDAKDVRYDEFELPEMKDDEILLKVMTDSICMSSYKAASQGGKHIRVPDNIKEKPIIMGHEFSGVIVKVGKKWINQYQVGEHFAINPAVPGQMESPGYSYEFFGGDVNYCIVPNEIIEKGCLLHYQGDTFYEASVAEPIFCIICGFKSNYHTVDQSHEHLIGTKKDGNLIILGGCGPMGLGAIAYALVCDNKPKKIVVTDINEGRLKRANEAISKEYAKANGVELEYVNTTNCTNEIETLMELTDGEGYDDVFIFAPIQSIAETGDKIMAVDGCMNIFAGAQDKNFSGNINLYNSHYRKTKIVGSSGGYMCDMEESLKLIKEKKINPALMITHIGGVDAAAETTLNLPQIPGGKKMIYSQIEMPLTAIDDFEKLGETNELFKQLAIACKKHHGLWNKEAENILLSYYGVN